MVRRREPTRAASAGPRRGRRHPRCHRGDGPMSSARLRAPAAEARGASPADFLWGPGRPPRPRQPVGPPLVAASKGVTSPRPIRPCRRTPSGRSVVASTPWRCEGPRAPRSRRGWCGPGRDSAARPTSHGAPDHRARARRLRMPTARGRCWSPKGQGRSPACGGGPCGPRSGPTYGRDIGLGVRGTGPAGCSSREADARIRPAAVKARPGLGRPRPKRDASVRLDHPVDDAVVRGPPRCS